jgi:uncharacterized protein with ParB-like and HNH nuclease domain
MSEKTLSLFPIDYPFETLSARMHSDPIKLKLDPDFQRKYKWDKEGWGRASKFIESCLMRIPLPACYFAENEDGSHIVIDGVQRLTTIEKFFSDDFALEGLTVFNELEGKRFSELGSLKNELESTTIRCIILRKENPKELIQEIFSRLNQGAVALTEQEIRHAIFPGTLDELLKKLGKVPSINRFGNTEKKSREDQELILRFLALQGDLQKYGDRLQKYLDAYMKSNQHIKQEECDKMETLFTSTLSKCETVFGDDVFMDTKKDKPRQSIVYYDLLMHSFSLKNNSFIRANKKGLKKAFEELCQDQKFQRTLSGGTQSKSSILKRRDLWEKRVNQITKTP